MIRIVIVDHHAVYRKSLRLILEQQHDISVIADAGDGLAAVELVKVHKPDVLLLGTGLSTILAVQGATILGGLLRLIPLTGITMPFFSYGGTAAVTDFIILGLLGLVSAERGVAYESADGQGSL
jgi:DNA-binding NarL/FixJ family response regulator